MNGTLRHGLRALLVAGALGCSDGDHGGARTTRDEDPARALDSGPRDAGADGDAAAGDASTGALDDARSASILLAVNVAEVEQGLTAVALGRDPDIRTFARHMVFSHQEALERQSELLRSLRVRPEESETSRALRRQSARTVERLTALPASAFDVAYTRAQLDRHERVLSLLDQRLLPAADSVPWRAELKATRAVVDSHVREARALLALLDGAPSEPGAGEDGAEDGPSDGGSPLPAAARATAQP